MKSIKFYKQYLQLLKEQQNTVAAPEEKPKPKISLKPIEISSSELEDPKFLVELKNCSRDLDSLTPDQVEEKMSQLSSVTTSFQNKFPIDGDFLVSIETFSTPSARSAVESLFPLPKKEKLVRFMITDSGYIKTGDNLQPVFGILVNRTTEDPVKVGILNEFEKGKVQYLIAIGSKITKFFKLESGKPPVTILENDSYYLEQIPKSKNGTHGVLNDMVRMGNYFKSFPKKTVNRQEEQQPAKRQFRQPTIK